VTGGGSEDSGRVRREWLGCLGSPGVGRIQVVFKVLGREGCRSGMDSCFWVWRDVEIVGVRLRER
jgi:hypothetical protein